MGSWSPENATKAYLRTLKMERKEKEPDSAEFISALAAGNNAQEMVIVCAENAVVNNIAALVSAAHQTGGSVTCILPTLDNVQSTRRSLKSDAKSVNFVVTGDSASTEAVLQKADFLLIDCNIQGYEQITRGYVRKGRGGVVVGFNAFCHGSSWQWSGLRTHLLPIGDGLLVTRIDGKGGVRKSNWVVKVDKCTGEEHVFRVRSSPRKLQVAV